MLDWITPAVSIMGSVAGGYMGVRISVTRLEVQMIHITGLTNMHEATLNQLEKRVVTIEGDLERMKIDIGTHDTGMRSDIHTHANVLTQHELRLHAVDKIPIQEL